MSDRTQKKQPRETVVWRQCDNPDCQLVIESIMVNEPCPSCGKPIYGKSVSIWRIKR